MNVLTRAALENLVTLAITADGVATPKSMFYGMKVGLIKDPISPDIDTVLADITPLIANYTGYALSSGLTWGAVFDTIDGQMISSRTNYTTYQPSDGATPNVILGAYAVDNAGTDLISVENFNIPISLVDENDAFQYAYTFSLSPTANYGLGVVV